MEKTNCECPLAGYCNRHKIEKSPHMHKLCQNHPKYFQMWEECRGPGQQNVTCKEEVVVPPVVREEQDQPQKKMPNLFQQAKNFAAASVEHVANGMKNAEKTVQETRMEICQGCEFMDVKSQRCTACGCFLPTKTKWASSSCPKGKW